MQRAWRAYGFHPDRIHKDGLFYISHVRVDDGTLHLEDEDVYDFKVDFPAYEEQARQTNMTVSLIDIAKPARRKGKPPLPLGKSAFVSPGIDCSSGKEIREYPPVSWSW